MGRGLYLRGLGGQVKGGFPPCVAPELRAGSPMTHWVLLVHVDLCRQDCHGGTAAGALAGTGPEMRLVRVGTVLLQGAPGAAGHRSDPQGAPLPSHPAVALQAQPLPQQGSPCLQCTPAAVGVGGPHAVPTGGMHGTGSNLHPGHLEAEVRAQLRGAPATARVLRCWGN